MEQQIKIQVQISWVGQSTIFRGDFGKHASVLYLIWNFLSVLFNTLVHSWSLTLFNCYSIIVVFNFKTVTKSMRDKMEGRSTRGRFPLLALWQLQVPVISKDYQPPLLPQFVYIVLYYIVQIYCILYYILNILYIILYCYIVLHSAAVNDILQFSFATSQ